MRGSPGSDGAATAAAIRPVASRTAPTVARRRRKQRRPGPPPASLSLCLPQGALLADKPFTEDGYNLLAVSRQLALGNGFSIDGVHPTNGVQPLFTVLAALAYLPFGTDQFAPLRLVTLLHGIR